MAAPSLRPYITREEYERLEDGAESKSEWFDGEIVAMPGASLPHETINRNLSRAATFQLEGTRCDQLDKDVRVKARLATTYPDLTIVGGDPAFDEKSRMATLLNPIALFEIVSPSSRIVDYERKWEAYQEIASLRDYVIVLQDRMRVEHYRREAGGLWLYQSLNVEHDRLQLAGTPFAISLAEIYRGVAFSDRRLPQ